MIHVDIKLSKLNIVTDVAAALNLFGRTIEIGAQANANKEAANLQELANYIRTPDDNDTKPIVARAMQEAWNRVKETCQRYYVHGRLYDDNRLESITVPEKRDGNFDIYTPYESVLVLDLVKNTTYHFAFDFNGCLDQALEWNFKLEDEIIHSCEIDSQTKIVKFDYTAKDSTDGCCIRLLPASANDFDNDKVLDSPSYIITWNRFGEYNLQLAMPDNFNIAVTSSITTYAHRFICDYIIAEVLKNQSQEGYTKYLATAGNALASLLRSLQARNSFGRVQHDWT